MSCFAGPISLRVWWCLVLGPTPSPLLIYVAKRLIDPYWRMVPNRGQQNAYQKGPKSWESPVRVGFPSSTMVSCSNYMTITTIIWSNNNMHQMTTPLNFSTWFFCFMQKLRHRFALRVISALWRTDSCCPKRVAVSRVRFQGVPWCRHHDLHLVSRYPTFQFFWGLPYWTLGVFVDATCHFWKGLV